MEPRERTSNTPRVAHDSPYGTIPLQKQSGLIGNVESVLNGEIGIICWSSWYVRGNWEEYCIYTNEDGAEKGNHRGR
jgi:hypothetical protein